MLADVFEAFFFPPGVVLVLCAAASALLLRARAGAEKGARAPLTAALVLTASAALLTYAVATPLAPWLLGSGLEGAYPPAASVQRTQAFVVLGAGLVPGVPLRSEAQLSQAATVRTDSAFAAWRTHRAPIVLSGGTASEEPRFSEAELMKRRLVTLGVPESDLVLEPGSANTADNARLTASLARERGWGSVAVVTSAMHMPRSVRAFDRAGLEVVPVPVDFRVPRGGFNWRYLLPNSEWVDVTASALHERVGGAWYAVRRGGA